MSIESILQVVAEFKEQGCDVYLYSGGIEKQGYESLCSILTKKRQENSRRKRVLLFLITPGGNPNAGFRIARALTHHYGADNFRVAVPMECKSAGTLVCIGAGSLVMFDRGELGPLDIQFQKQDELFEMSSGLDILRGMTYLRKEALESFGEYLVEINAGSGMSTKIASEIAGKLIIGLFEPIFAQVDPAHLGEMNAALQIAHEYGTRLQEKAKNLHAGALSKLIHNYPTHGFVIDRAEARTLFKQVDPPTETERRMGLMVRAWMSRGQSDGLQVEDMLAALEKYVSERKESTDAGSRHDDTRAAPVTASESLGEPAASETIGEGTAPSAVDEQPSHESEQDAGSATGGA